MLQDTAYTLHSFKAHLNLDANVSSELLDSYLDFVKFTTEKVESHI